jgi:hypothetical protein
MVMRRDTWVATPLEFLLKSPESTASEPRASVVDMAALAFAVGAMFSFLQGREACTRTLREQADQSEPLFNGGDCFGGAWKIGGISNFGS